ncbi:(5-formylfuran-3-yl)methyl phosphate synthase [Rhodospirillaceae bacterium SYSU D60014]|uniref:(5-formylfuran-3-yl)methyl phosphate synthase n=1 Tax=Virgifigura deserti TaxID=2268457 RepID=UPI000E664626
MTGLLASVTSAEEAEMALAAGADIIDLKDPQAGALGALPAPVICEAVEQVAGRRIVSATAGDLPMEPEIVGQAVARIAALGVDIVKIGMFPGRSPEACLDALAAQTARGTRLVAVLFADQSPDLGMIKGLADRGFTGVMLDTMDKSGGGLRCHLDDALLGRFVERSAELGLLNGLAGSLAIADIEPLLLLGADYLGFRGALCANGRSSVLEPSRMRAVRAAIEPQAAITSPARRALQPRSPAHSAPPTP